MKQLVVASNFCLNLFIFLHKKPLLSWQKPAYKYNPLCRDRKYTESTFRQSLRTSFQPVLVRSANAIFGEIGRTASEEVVLQLIISKCILYILYGLEACPLTKSDLLSMDFVINRSFMKLFKTSNINNVKYCQECF